MNKDSSLLLSICIPTFNRLECLENCLESIKKANIKHKFNFEVCITDNNPKGTAKKLSQKYSNYYNINYKVNEKNIGVGKNILNSVDRANGKYSWILGNDDMLLENTFVVIDNLFNKYSDVDFFFINSYSVNSELILGNPEKNLNLIKTQSDKFSQFNSSLEVNFQNLIDHKVSWDFLLGIFLSIFNTKKWKDNKKIVKLNEVSDSRFYTNKYNTFPHIFIFAKAFMHSKAYIQHEPLTINLIGKREWAYLYPLVESVRIPQVLDVYRNYGLPYIKYIKQKNFALRRFLPGFFKMFFLKKSEGIQYVSLYDDVFKNIFYPSIYYYGIYYLLLKLFKILFKKNK